VKLLRVLLATVVAISGVSLSTPSFAATVNPIDGQVLVNQGVGYRRVTGSTEASPGSTVVVNPGGSAQIVYPDGCVVEVQPGAVVTIQEVSPCSTAPQQQPGFGLNTTTLAIGAVAVGGGIAAIILSQKDKSASP
jgi:hypothetical protein